VINELKEAYSVSQLCLTMERPRSSYYAWCRARGAAPRRDEARLAKVRQIHQQTRRSYGTRRMAAELRRQGLPVGRHRARTLMRQAGVWADRRRRHSYRRADRPAATAPNRLDRHFQVAVPNRVWVGDITFLPTHQGWLYLAIVVDLYARRIVGWAFSTTPNTELTLAALQVAVRDRRPGPGLMFHSDQGAQYTSLKFVQQLCHLGIVQSMSRRGNCWDNAVAERVFATLKREWIDPHPYRTRFDAEADVSLFLRSYYNYHRLHAAAGQHPPAIYEAMTA
jgi:putative transposase